MLSRGLNILSALADYPHGVSVTELARTLDLPVSTTHRLLSTEIDMGFVSLDAERKTYQLGVRVFELANRVRSVLDISDVAHPVMRALSEATGETVQLSVLNNGQALFIEKVGTEQAIGIRGAVGRGEPLYATSTGKILLSQLEEGHLDGVLKDMDYVPWTSTTITSGRALRREIASVREQDFATADEEFDKGVRALGVPVRDGRGATRAALCISAPAFRVSMDQLRDWLPKLRETAHEIGVRMPLASSGL
ncbi:MAG: IclR family transcriptional regulator [Pseudoclavibacter sp.]